MSRASRLAIGSVVIGLIVMGLKLAAWWITGSVALLSDALESTVNIVAAIAVIVSLRVAEKPADENHPFGHHKAEYFSAVFEGVMIVVAAMLILYSAATHILAPEPILAPLPGLVLNLSGAALNGVWAFVLIRQGRALSSPALVADGRHIWSDVVTSFGVALGVVLAVWTGWLLLDPLLAIFVAVNVLWSGWQVIRSSVGGLMDEALDADEIDVIGQIIRDAGEGALQAHDIHTRRAGRAVFIEFHLVMDGDVSVRESHAICDRIEHALSDRFEDAKVIIHVEPEEKAKSRAVEVPGDQFP